MPLKICLEIAAVATVTALVLLKLYHCAMSGRTMKKGKNVERGFGLENCNVSLKTPHLTMLLVYMVFQVGKLSRMKYCQT